MNTQKTRRRRGRGVVTALALLWHGAAFSEETRDQTSAAAGPVTTREMVEVRGLSGLAVSPQGDRAVIRIDRQILDENRTDISWHIVDLRSGASAFLASAGDPLWHVNGGLDIEMPQWSADGGSVYFRKLSDQEVQVWQASPRHGAWQLTHDPANVLAFIADGQGGVSYATPGATRADIIAAEAAEYASGIVMDSTIIPGFPLVRSFPLFGRMTTQRFLLPGSVGMGRATLLGDRPLAFRVQERGEAKTAAAGPVASKGLSDWWLSSAGALTPFDPDLADHATAPGGLGVVYLTRSTVTPQKPQQVALAWRVAGGDEVICRHDRCTGLDDAHLVGWANPEDLVFQTRVGGVRGLRIWNVPSGSVRSLISTERVLGSNMSGAVGPCRLARAEAICIASGGDKPPRLIAIDLETGSERTLLDPNPNLTTSRLGKVETMTLRDSAGSTTRARLVLPRAADSNVSRRPLVITSYTCDGFLAGGTGQDVPEHVLAGAGYVALCMDLSVHTIRLAAGVALDTDAFHQRMLELAENAIDQLDTRGLIDRSRVVLAGFSGSATGATYILPRSKAFSAQIITTQGVLDPMNYYLTSLRSGHRMSFVRNGYKPPFDTPSNPFFRRNSPSFNASRITTPLLMQLADVEYITMMQLFSTMRDLGRGVEMVVFPDEYHIKRQPRHRLAVYERNVDWVNFWLVGKESPQPDRQAQNLRWRAMKDNQCKLFDGDPPLSAWYCRN